MKKNEYICPICGAKVEIGKHFCLVENERGSKHEGEDAEDTKPKWKMAVNSGIASLLVIATLWGQIGAYSLAALLLPVVALAITLGRSWRRARHRPSSRLVSPRKSVLDRDRR